MAISEHVRKFVGPTPNSSGICKFFSGRIWFIHSDTVSPPQAHRRCLLVGTSATSEISHLEMPFLKANSDGSLQRPKKHQKTEEFRGAGCSNDFGAAWCWGTWGAAAQLGPPIGRCSELTCVYMTTIYNYIYIYIHTYVYVM